MKKLKIIAIALVLSLTFTSIAVAKPNNFNLKMVEYPIMVEGKEYSNPDLPVLNYEGNTYVPLKAISRLLSTQVQWNDLLRRVEITKETTKLTFTAEQTDELDRLLHNGSLKVAQDVQVSLNDKPVNVKSEPGEYEVDSVSLILNRNQEAIQVNLETETDTDTDTVTTKIDKPKKKLKVKLTCCPIGIEITWESEGGISNPGTGEDDDSSVVLPELANQELSFDLNKDQDSIRKVLSADNMLVAAQDATVEYNGAKIDYFAAAGVESIYQIDTDNINIQFNEKGEASIIQISNKSSENEEQAGLMKPKPKVVLKVTCCPLSISVGVSF